MAGAAGRRPSYGRVVVCVHGLSRQGRDFDVLARVLSERARVIAVDVAGRGHSDWLDDPMGYQVPTYVADLATLLMHLRAEQPDVAIDWVGTSMGGLIGMALAAQAGLAPRRMVLNDVGPVIQWAAVALRLWLISQLLCQAAHFGRPAQHYQHKCRVQRHQGRGGRDRRCQPPGGVVGLGLCQRRGLCRWSFHLCIPDRSARRGLQQPQRRTGGKHGQIVR